MRDDEPFAGTSSDLGRGVAQMLGGEVAGKGIEADATRRLRLRIEAWVRARELRIVDGVIVVVDDDVPPLEVAIPLYAVTGQTAVLKVQAPSPTAATLTVEPRRWTHGVFARGAVKLGDVPFDAKWTVTSTEAALARQLVDETVRRALAACTAWCRLSYAAGAIEVRLDADDLAGAHLLQGAALAVSLARVRVTTAAYR